MSNKKVPNEQETKANLLGWAKKYGCYDQLVKLYSRYEDLLKGARSEEERKAIQVLGINEFNKFFGSDKITHLKFKDGSTMMLDDKNDIIVDDGKKESKVK